MPAWWKAVNISSSLRPGVSPAPIICLFSIRCITLQFQDFPRGYDTSNWKCKANHFSGGFAVRLACHVQRRRDERRRTSSAFSGLGPVASPRTATIAPTHEMSPIPIL
jgi:hypothetical protein